MFKCSTVHPECKFDGATGKSWKIHASRHHHGYSEKQWLQVANAASSMPAGHFTDVPPTEEGAAATDASKVSAAPQPMPELNAAKDRLCEMLATAVAGILKQTLTVEVKTDDEKILREGFESAAALVNLKSEIAPVEKTIRSPWWALVFPIGAILLVILKRANLAELFQKLAGSEGERDSRSDRAEGQRKDNAGPTYHPGTSREG